MPRKLPSADRKVQVLAAARTLFAKQGYAGTTVDEIARKAGVSRPRVLQLFGSKQRIYEAIAETAYRSHPMDRDLADPIRRRDDFEVFETFARHILHHTRKRAEREIFKILMNARLMEDRFHRVHFHRQDTLMIGRLEDYVRQRIEDGVFRSMDPRVVIYAYQAMVSNLAIYKNVMKKMEFVTADELSRSCAAIFMAGLAIEPSIRSKRGVDPKKGANRGT
jgi:AcrR family transcriptional regulator